MAEIPRLLFGSGVVVKSGLLDKTQAERFKALILAKNEKALALHSILDKKPFEEEFASKVKAVLAETSSASIPLDDMPAANPTSSLASSSASSSSSSACGSVSTSTTFSEHDEVDLPNDEHDEYHDVILEAALSPSKGGLAAMRAKGKAPKLNLSVVAAANKTTAAVKQDEEAQQADELLKIKRMRQHKRQSLPERLPTEVQQRVEGTEQKVHHNQH